MITKEFRPLEEAARFAAKSLLKSVYPNWLNNLTPKRLDIHCVLSYAHGAINPDTNLYVTPGKRSVNWDGPGAEDISMKNIYYEGVAMRLIVDAVAKYLSMLGVPNTVVGHPWKDWSIRKKCDIINNLDLDRKRSFGCEPHSNSTKKKVDKVQGFEIFTSPGDTPADPMATILGEEAHKEFPGLRFRSGYGTTKETTSDSDKEARFGILTGTNIPYILFESLFHNNKEYCMKILMTEEGRYRIAKVITIACIRIINERF